MNQLVPALQVALVLVIVLVLYELVRLQRAIRTAQLSLPDMDEIRRLNQAIHESAMQAENASRALIATLQRLESEAQRRATTEERGHDRNRTAAGVEVQVEPEPEPESEPYEQPSESPSPVKRGPRVLSEAGRAKYDRVLHLAARGLDIGSIAREVDLTRAEVELMLGSVG